MRRLAIALFASGLGLAPVPAFAFQSSGTPASPAAIASPAPGAVVPVIGPPPAGTYVINAIDVGTGLSILVEGKDFTLLYDAGSNDDGARGDDNRVLAYLRAVRPDLKVIDHLLLSHPHEDHDAMIDDVLTTYEVRNVWDSGSLNNTCAYHAFLDAVAAEPGVAYHDALGSGGTHVSSFTPSTTKCHGAVRAATVNVPRADQIVPGADIPLGAGAKMTILHADGNATGKHLNDASVVTRLHLGNRHILLMGDAGGENEVRNPPSTPARPDSVEGELLAKFKTALPADVLIVGHHGSMTSSRVNFLDAVDADNFVISVGPKLYSGTRLPDAAVVAELTRRGSVWRTDRNDATCGQNPRKIGADKDGKPGGCDNIQIFIDATGAITAGYSPLTD
jgi:beta-lactamase superfamily II metal-dependent hydrolase